MDFRLRLAEPRDLAAIDDIFNHYVVRSTATYATESVTPQEREAWFARHGALHPVTVVEHRGAVVAWGALSRFREPAAYARTVENSVYVRADLHRRGIGRMVLADSIARAKAIGHHAIIAVIDAEQHASIALHAALGFEEVARLKEAGFKFGRWLDVVYMEWRDG